MIIDSSAIIAVLQDESEAPAIVDVLAAEPDLAISAATLLEASVVADGPRDPVRSARFDALVDALAMEVVPLTAVQSAIARQAYRDYGRGSGHPARLNLGDCFSYALAAERADSLLFVGDDFGHTDMRSALPHR